MTTGTEDKLKYPYQPSDKQKREKLLISLSPVIRRIYYVFGKSKTPEVAIYSGILFNIKLVIHRGVEPRTP